MALTPWARLALELHIGTAGTRRSRTRLAGLFPVILGHLACERSLRVGAGARAHHGRSGAGRSTVPSTRRVDYPGDLGSQARKSRPEGRLLGTPAGSGRGTRKLRQRTRTNPLSEYGAESSG
jgi:hypothetical protein